LNNIFELLPVALEAEVFEAIVHGDKMKIERIVSRGHSTPAGEWYDQDQNEWVMVLAGEAIVSVEHAGEHHLVPGSYLNLPAHTRHRVQWTTPGTETIWLAIHY
jgi:cupin 2 domain-containing protein